MVWYAIYLVICNINISPSLTVSETRRISVQTLRDVCARLKYISRPEKKSSDDIVMKRNEKEDEINRGTNNEFKASDDKESSYMKGLCEIRTDSAVEKLQNIELLRNS